MDTVRTWRKRYAADGLKGIKDRPRPGRPQIFGPVQVAGIKALACTPPPDKDIPLARWSGAELVAQAAPEGLVESISPATVARWLAQDAIKPWQHRSWIFPRDPAFEVKAAKVLDLYARTWDNEPLGPDDYVISGDEKSQLQALRRQHPGLGAAPGRTGGSSSHTAGAEPSPTPPFTTSTTRTSSARSPKRPGSPPSRTSCTR